MRLLRPLNSILLILALVAACGSTSSGDANDGGGGSSGATASSDVGGYGGGGSSEETPPGDGNGGGGGSGSGVDLGNNGTITYQLGGDLESSGELKFVYLEGAMSQFAEGGWVAYFYSDSDPNLIIQINSNPASNILNYGDGESLVVGTEEAGCTFDYSTNDESGLVGTIDCPTTVASNVNTGDLITVSLHATVDAHT